VRAEKVRLEAEWTRTEAGLRENLAAREARIAELERSERDLQIQVAKLRGDAEGLRAQLETREIEAAEATRKQEERQREVERQAAERESQLRERVQLLERQAALDAERIKEVEYDNLRREAEIYGLRELVGEAGAGKVSENMEQLVDLVQKRRGGNLHLDEKHSGPEPNGRDAGAALHGADAGQDEPGGPGKGGGGGGGQQKDDDEDIASMTEEDIRRQGEMLAHYNKKRAGAAQGDEAEEEIPPPPDQ
jgi:hypothetical protein